MGAKPSQHAYASCKSSRGKVELQIDYSGFKPNSLLLIKIVYDALQCGVYGTVVSSLDGSPLPASISVKGINFTVCINLYNVWCNNRHIM